MNRLREILETVGRRLGSKNRLVWIVLTLFLPLVYLLARQVEPQSYTVLKQFLALYAIDSALFFFVDQQHAKMGVLSLTFLLIIEMFVSLFFVLAIYSGGLR